MKNILIGIFLFALLSCGGNADVADKPAAAVAPAVQKVQRPQQQVKRPQAPPAQSGPYKAKNEGWLTNMEEAYALSKKSGKPIMANFTGSDWCGWCKKLDRSVFHQAGFEKWAKDNVVLLEVDFPKRFRLPEDVAAQNNTLKQAFAVRGFPSIWVFDADKDANGSYNFKKLGKTGYTKTLAEFQTNVGNFIAKR